MSDETSLVSGRFTKLENGSPGIGLGSRSRLETSGDSDDRIGWRLSCPRSALGAVASRLREPEEVSRIEKLVPDTDRSDRTRQNRLHGRRLTRTESTDSIRSDTCDVRWSIGRGRPSRPTPTRRRPRRRGTVSPSGPVRSGPVRSGPRPPCPRRPRLLAF